MSPEPEYRLSSLTSLRQSPDALGLATSELASINHCGTAATDPYILLLDLSVNLENVAVRVAEEQRAMPERLVRRP